MDPGKGMFEVVPSNSVSTGSCDIVCILGIWTDGPCGVNTTYVETLDEL